MVKSIQVQQANIRSMASNLNWETIPNWQMDMISMMKKIDTYWKTCLQQEYKKTHKLVKI